MPLASSITEGPIEPCPRHHQTQSQRNAETISPTPARFRQTMNAAIATNTLPDVRTGKSKA